MKKREFLLTSAALAAAPLLVQTKSTASSNEVLQGETVTLAQGLQGYYTRPQGKGSFPSVLVFMEAFGLNSYVKDVCARMAKAGYAALAPDFYHGDTFAYKDIQSAIAKAKSLNDDTVMTEVGQGLAFLAKRREVVANKVGVVGFCMGGRFAFLANSVHANQLKAVACFYGGGIAPQQDPLGRKPLLERVEAMQAPLLLIYGAQDNSITPDEHERITRSLSAAKKRYTLSVFPKAGHGFASDRRDSYVAAAAEEAWQMTMNFFSRNLT